MENRSPIVGMLVLHSGGTGEQPGPQTRSLALHRGARIYLGRHPDCAIMIRDRRVARRHACIDSEETGVYVSDMHTVNPTYVNGAAIDARRPLSDGDVIQLGEHFVRYSALGASGWPDARDDVRRPDLEALARGRPRDEAPLEVYADWLQSADSPLGALIALQMAERRGAEASDVEARLTALLDRHSARLFGQLSRYVAPQQYQLVLHNGFAQRLRVSDVDMAHVLDFLARPVAALLRELDVGTVWERDGKLLLAGLREHGQHELLASLALGAGESCEALLPELCAEPWPALERLRLTDRERVGSGPLLSAALAPLLADKTGERMPKLRELELRLLLHDPEKLGAIFESALGKRLRILRLVALVVDGAPFAPRALPVLRAPAQLAVWLSLDVVLAALGSEYHTAARADAAGLGDLECAPRLRELGWPPLDVLAREDIPAFVDYLNARGDTLMTRALASAQDPWRAPAGTVERVVISEGLVRLEGSIDGAASWYALPEL